MKKSVTSDGHFSKGVLEFRPSPVRAGIGRGSGDDDDDDERAALVDVVVDVVVD